MPDATGPVRPGASGGRTDGRTSVDFGVEAGRERRPEDTRPVSPGRTVYGGRPLRPLRDAVGQALDLPDREAVGPDEADWAALWSRPEVAARLVQAFADHAVSCRAGRVLAPRPADRELAAPVAARLGLPLTTGRPGDGGPQLATEGRQAFLVARMLHDRNAAGGGAGGLPGAAVAGVAAVVRVSADSPRRPHPYNILSVIDLKRTI